MLLEAINVARHEVELMYAVRLTHSGESATDASSNQQVQWSSEAGLEGKVRMPCDGILGAGVVVDSCVSKYFSPFQPRFTFKPVPALSRPFLRSRYRGTSLIRKHLSLGPYSRHMPIVLRRS